VAQTMSDQNPIDDETMAAIEAVARDDGLSGTV
jgi:hypothetical protein